VVTRECSASRRSNHFYPVPDKGRRSIITAVFTAAAGHATVIRRGPILNSTGTNAFVAEPTETLVATIHTRAQGSDVVDTTAGTDWPAPMKDARSTPRLARRPCMGGHCTNIVQHTHSARLQDRKGKRLRNPRCGKTHGRIYRSSMRVQTAPPLALDPTMPSGWSTSKNDNQFWRMHDQRASWSSAADRRRAPRWPNCYVIIWLMRLA